LLVLPILLIYQIALPLAGFFGDDFPELLRDKCIRFILIVACFFAAAFACNVDRFSGNRVGLFTATFAFLFFVNLSFAAWGAAYPNMENRFGRGAPLLQYLWMLGSYFYGLFTWWLIRRAERRIKGLPGNVTKSQFTIGSILAWIALTGFTITLLKSSTLQILQDSNLDPNASIDVVVCAVFCALLTLPLTLGLMRTRRPLLLALGCWIICFVAAGLLFAMIGYSDTEYDWRDGYVTTIFAFALAVAVFLFWIQTMRIVLRLQTKPRDHGNTRPRLASRLTTVPFAIVSIGLWCLLGFWTFANFGTFSKERSFAAFDSSPLILQQLEDAYGVETIAQVREAHDPQKIHEWLNHLSRERVPKKDDLIYQIASLTRLEYIDRPEAKGLYRKQMGFSVEEVASLPDESIEAWVKNNRVEPANEEAIFYEDDVSEYLSGISNAEFAWQLPSVPWDERSMPLASQFCREKQTLIQRIRHLIKSCEAGTFPDFEHGFFLNDDIPRFAADMLFIDTRQAIAGDELSRTFNNLECVSKLAKLNYPLSGWSFFRQRIRARAMGILIHLAEVKQLDESEVIRLRQLAGEFNLPVYESEISKARTFARLMLEHRSNMDSKKDGKNYLLLDRKLESRLIAAFPQTVHWPSYIEARKERFDYMFALRKDVQSTPAKLSELYGIATSDTELEQPFHQHLLNLLEIPQARARRLGAIDYDYDLNQLKLFIVFAIRAKLREIALELLLFRAANGDFPRSLQELDCGTEDPFSNQGFIYRTNGDRFELYSVGANKEDDKGEQFDTDDFSFFWPARTLAEYFEDN
jgi:hypothetical protein